MYTFELNLDENVDVNFKEISDEHIVNWSTLLGQLCDLRDGALGIGCNRPIG